MVFIRKPGGRGVFAPRLPSLTPREGVWSNAEARTLYDRDPTGWPDAACRSAMDAAITRLKLAGIWALTDALQVYYGPSATAALLDWKDSSRAATLHGTTPPSFSTNGGITTDAVDNYVNTHINPSLCTNFVQNSACLAGYFGANAGVGAPIGGDTSTNVFLDPSDASSHVAGRLNNNVTVTNTGVSNSTDFGSAYIDRNGTALEVGKQGVALGTTTAASTGAPPNENITLGRSVGNFRAGNFYALWMGGHLTAAQKAALHDILTDYFFAIGMSTSTVPFVTLAAGATTAHTIPDGLVPPATAGKGLSCTGLRIDSDNTKWVGAGRGVSGVNSTGAGVAHLAADYSLLAYYDIATIDGALPAGSVQGLDLIGNNVGFVLKVPGVAAYLVQISKAGAFVSSQLLPDATINGFTYDSKRDRYVFSKDDGSIGWHLRDTVALDPAMNQITGITNLDHLSYIASLDALTWTGGSNGSAGVLRVMSGYDISQRITRERRLTYAGVVAMEGSAWDGTTMFMCSDDYTHSVGTGLNQIFDTPLAMAA